MQRESPHQKENSGCRRQNLVTFDETFDEKTSFWSTIYQLLMRVLEGALYYRTPNTHDCVLC